MKDFDAEVERVWEVYGTAWSRNWGFVPMTREEFFADGQGDEADSQARTGADRRSRGRVVGFALALPDVNSGPETGRREACSRRGSSKSCIINV